MLELKYAAVVPLYLFHGNPSLLQDISLYNSASLLPIIL